MNKLVTFIAVVLLVIGVYLSRWEGGRSNISQIPQVLSEEEEKEEEATPTVGSFQEEKTPTPRPKDDQPLAETPAPQGLSNFQYPNATVVSSSETFLTQESTDNADTITDWYKEKIKEQGLGVTSFVTTKTNDNVLNKLVGANGQREIRVEITKEAGTSIVNISVELKSS